MPFPLSPCRIPSKPRPERDPFSLSLEYKLSDSLGCWTSWGVPELGLAWGPAKPSLGVISSRSSLMNLLQCFILELILAQSSLVAQRVKNLPAVQETWVQSLGQEDPLEKGMATHSSILAWGIPWAEKPGGLQSMGLQGV